MRHNALTLLSWLLQGNKVTIEGRDYTLERTEEGNKPVICTQVQKFTLGEAGTEEIIQIGAPIRLEWFIEQAEKIPESEIFLMGGEMALKDIRKK